MLMLNIIWIYVLTEIQEIIDGVLLLQGLIYVISQLNGSNILGWLSFDSTWSLGFFHLSLLTKNVIPVLLWNINLV